MASGVAECYSLLCAIKTGAGTPGALPGLVITCGLRAMARRHWLQEGRWMDEDGREWRGWALVVRHYSEDAPLNLGGRKDHLRGFWLKDRESDKARPYRLEPDLLLPRTGLLMAPDLSYTARYDLVHREMSQEMRPIMPETKGTNHNSAQAERERGVGSARH